MGGGGAKEKHACGSLSVMLGGPCDGVATAMGWPPSPLSSAAVEERRPTRHGHGGRMRRRKWWRVLALDDGRGRFGFGCGRGKDFEQMPSISGQGRRRGRQKSRRKTAGGGPQKRRH
mmetsp:Transcript_19669/g.57173  ORF Transcript_19669/g.57173 Transcript_19669/m.57173 type:complete len:117 (+) Transcript_19669:208-558(+)